MSGGLVGLFDDIAALAKLAAASVDDVGAAAGRASTKAAGVVIDDTAVIKRIALGSLKNKLIFILPAALVLSEFVPILVEIILMLGGTYLCFEGAEKIHHRIKYHDDGHDVPAVVAGHDQEEATVAGAIRTDFILSAEIMVIALKEVIDEGFVSRAIILAVVAVAITAIVYGIVALIVKMDDVGLRMAESDSEPAQRVGRALVHAMPKLLGLLSVVGTAAMIWVGGHILIVGAEELGWHWPHDVIHDIEHAVEGVAGIGGVLAWLLATLASALVGLLVGFAVVGVVSRLPIGGHDDPAAAH